MTCLDPELVAKAYARACRDELMALKPGNVHVFTEGDRRSVVDFQTSADASAASLAQPGATIGQRIRGAIEATRAEVAWNTNLGIVLLCAPIAAAAETGGTLRQNLAAILDRLDIADAQDAFAAIRLANPGGLGSSETHDVAEPPQVTLREAMAAAAHRDRIARAYVTGFDDLFSVGLPVLRQARARGASRHWAIAAVHMAFLANAPDTHIARNFGAAAAEAVRRQAADLASEIEIGPDELARLIAFDAALKLEGLNPGTCADFTVATTFLDDILTLSGGQS